MARQEVHAVTGEKTVIDLTPEEAAVAAAAVIAETAAKNAPRFLLSEIDRKLNAQRWTREGILGLGELINILRAVPSEITTVAELVAYLQAIPPCGTGMEKLRLVEEQAQSLRAQL